MMPNGKPLGKNTREDLLALASGFERLAAEMQKREGAVVLTHGDNDHQKARRQLDEDLGGAERVQDFLDDPKRRL